MTRGRRRLAIEPAPTDPASSARRRERDAEVAGVLFTDHGASCLREGPLGLGRHLRIWKRREARKGTDILRGEIDVHVAVPRGGVLEVSIAIGVDEDPITVAESRNVLRCEESRAHEILQARADLSGSPSNRSMVSFECFEERGLNLLRAIGSDDD